jgi:hypothetical protein
MKLAYLLWGIKGSILYIYTLHSPRKILQTSKRRPFLRSIDPQHCDLEFFVRSDKDCNTYEIMPAQHSTFK